MFCNGEKLLKRQQPPKQPLLMKLWKNPATTTPETTTQPQMKQWMVDLPHRRASKVPEPATEEPVVDEPVGDIIENPEPEEILPPDETPLETPLKFRQWNCPPAVTEEIIVTVRRQRKKWLGTKSARARSRQKPIAPPAVEPAPVAEAPAPAPEPAE